MGKGTDKLYITHSEWASGDQFSASAGAGVAARKTNAGAHASFRRLPFNFCAASLQPFSHPVCTRDGTIFDLVHILPWLKKHGTNPVSGQPLRSAELIKLHFARNEQGEYCDPVTYKPLTDNTHIVALDNTGNVFAWETIQRLNVKAKNWRDLVSDEEFSRKNIITLQDPQHLEARDLSSFKYLKDGVAPLKGNGNGAAVTEELEAAKDADRSDKILRAKEAVAKARAGREASKNGRAEDNKTTALSKASLQATQKSAHIDRRLPSNAAAYTTGQAAASFTSTGLTPHTSNERALLSEEDYLLKPRRVKDKGYARIETTHGDIAVELFTEFAPRAVWNFVHLAKRGYYKDVPFHRSIRNFMLQGGDPTGSGKGGSSVWGKPFADEFAQSPLKHDSRGVLSMANKGRNSNTSQFFITYRAATHLDRKHTIFGRVIDGYQSTDSEQTLKKLEALETDSSDRPVEECAMQSIVVFVDPFEEFKANKAAKDIEDEEQEAIRRQGGTEDDKVTWTGKRVRREGEEDEAGGAHQLEVGKYLDAGAEALSAVKKTEQDAAEPWLTPSGTDQPSTKKRRAGGFGNFDGW